MFIPLGKAVVLCLKKKNFWQEARKAVNAAYMGPVLCMYIFIKLPLKNKCLYAYSEAIVVGCSLEAIFVLE